MAIAIRGGSPGVAATGSNPITLTLNGTRQPQAGDLVVCFYGNDFYLLSNMPTTPTFNGSTTGVNAITGGTADGGNSFAHIKSYWFAPSSTADITISATETGLGDEEKVMVGYVLTGADTVSPIDGTASNNFDNTGATTNRVCLAVSPAASDSFLIAHTNDGNGSNSVAYNWGGTGMTEQYDGVLLGSMGYSGATQQLVASGSTGNKTAVATGNASYASVMVAIKTAAAGGGASPSTIIVAPPWANMRAATW